MKNAFVALFNLQGGELIMIGIVILVLFGAKRIPEFAKGLGQGIKEFKKASNDVKDEIHRAGEEEPAPAPKRAAPPAASTETPAPAAKS
jgi:sec-independent protein translocase protein TatA